MAYAFQMRYIMPGEHKASVCKTDHLIYHSFCRGNCERRERKRGDKLQQGGKHELEGLTKDGRERMEEKEGLRENTHTHKPAFSCQWFASCSILRKADVNQWSIISFFPDFSECKWLPSKWKAVCYYMNLCKNKRIYLPVKYTTFHWLQGVLLNSNEVFYFIKLQDFIIVLFDI